MIFLRCKLTLTWKGTKRGSLHSRFQLREQKAIKRGTKNQKGFSSMLIMEYYCPAIGLVRLTVGQKRNDGAKVQYCITAIEVP